MPKPIEPTSVRQGRLGSQILVILVASLLLALISGWVLWGLFFNAGEEDAALSAGYSVSSVEDGIGQPRRLTLTG